MPLPPELSALLDAGDEIARETAWKQFVETHSPLLLHAARAVGRSYDATMDAYAYLLEQLRRDDFHRLRAYVADDRSGSGYGCSSSRAAYAWIICGNATVDRRLLAPEAEKPARRAVSSSYRKRRKVTEKKPA